MDLAYFMDQVRIWARQQPEFAGCEDIERVPADVHRAYVEAHKTDG